MALHRVAQAESGLALTGWPSEEIGMLVRKVLMALILLAAFPCSGCQQQSSTPTATAPDSSLLTWQSTISVPEGRPVVVDGTVSPGEWDGARVEVFSDGSELLLMYSEGYLYLGIRASTPEMIAGNVFIDRGDKVAILHASAALGTALYQKGVQSWQQTQDFVWRCRATDSSGAAQAEREAFLHEERWVAANSRMGSPNELEYRIEVTTETLRLAVNFLRALDPNVKIPWPIHLDDDCIEPTPGGLPAQMRFSPDRWSTIAVPYPGR